MPLNLKQRIEEKDLISFKPKIKKLGLLGKIFLGLGILGFSSFMNSCAVDETAQRNNNQNTNQTQEESKSEANPLLGLIAAGIFDYTNLDPALKDVLQKSSEVVYNQQLQEQRNEAIRNSGKNNTENVKEWGEYNQKVYSNPKLNDDLVRKMNALKDTDYWVDFNGTVFKKSPESFVCLDVQDLNKNGFYGDYYDLIGLKSIFTVNEIEKNSNCLYFGITVSHIKTSKLILKVKDSKGGIKYVTEWDIPYGNCNTLEAGTLDLVGTSILDSEKAKNRSNTIEEFSAEWYTNGILARKDMFFIDYSSKK